MKYQCCFALLFGMAGLVSAQEQTTASCRIICMETSDKILLIDAVNLVTNDTLTLISLPATLPADRSGSALRVSGEYVFEIADIDHFMRQKDSPVRLPYLLQFPQQQLNRFGRDGRSTETTQYLLRNTWGSQIAKEHVLTF